METCDKEILRGRKEIAIFLRLSLATVDDLIDRKILPNCRITGHKQGVVFATKRKLLEFLDRETDRQGGRIAA